MLMTLLTQIWIWPWDTKLRFMEGREIPAVSKRQDDFLSLTASTRRGLLDKRARHERKCCCIHHSLFSLIQPVIKHFSRKSAWFYGFNDTNCIPVQRKHHYSCLCTNPELQCPRTWNNCSLSSALFLLSHYSVSRKVSFTLNVRTSTSKHSSALTKSTTTTTKTKRLKQLTLSIYVKLLDSHRSP